MRDLIAIRDYIGAFNPTAAECMSLRLEDAGNGLGENPERGVAIGGGRRQLATIQPYLIRYRTRADAVEILAIRHSARNRVG